MNQQIAILGSRTLLGQHLISAVDCELNIRKKLWDYSDGLESLDAILTGSAIVGDKSLFHYNSRIGCWERGNAGMPQYFSHKEK